MPPAHALEFGCVTLTQVTLLLSFRNPQVRLPSVQFTHSQFSVIVLHRDTLLLSVVLGTGALVHSFPKSVQRDLCPSPEERMPLQPLPTCKALAHEFAVENNSWKLLQFTSWLCEKHEDPSAVVICVSFPNRQLYRLHECITVLMTCLESRICQGLSRGEILWTSRAQRGRVQVNLLRM